MDWVAGTIVAGHGIAGGGAADSPYPAGSIALQAPHFLHAGIDLSPYFPATLNVDLAPHKPQARRIVFDGLLRWYGDIEERFVLARIEACVHGCEYAGLWYYPHPATKPAHFQRDTVVELLLPFIDGLASGDALAVRF
jgi:hypothetical protein